MQDKYTTTTLRRYTGIAEHRQKNMAKLEGLKHTKLLAFLLRVKSSLFYHTLKSTQAGSSERPCGHLCQLHQIAILKQYQM